jgi:hypothetical protein
VATLASNRLPTIGSISQAIYQVGAAGIAASRLESEVGIASISVPAPARWTELARSTRIPKQIHQIVARTGISWQPLRPTMWALRVGNVNVAADGRGDGR